MKDLKQEFLQARINKAKVELKAVLDKHQLLLSAEMNYSQGGIFPIVKLVERTEKQEKAEETALDKKETNN